MSQAERATYIPIMVASYRPINVSFRSVVLGLRRYVSPKESNVTGVIFDLFFTIKTRPASGGNVGVGSGWGMGVSKRVKCDAN